MPVPVLPPSKSPQAPAAWRPRHAAGREAARRWREAAVRALRAPRAVHVRIADKFSFFLGVVGCSVTQWVFLDAPEWMGVLYTCAIFPLLALRYSMYAARRMHYFLLDFCYFVQALLLLHVHVLPCDRRLHFALFALTTGPIGLAVLAWRNSLVFHSVDKMSSAFIHLLPVGVMHCIHWYPKCEAEQPGWRAAEASTAEWLAPALGIYATWQLGYVRASTRACAARAALARPIAPAQWDGRAGSAAALAAANIGPAACLPRCAAPLRARCARRTCARRWCWWTCSWRRRCGASRR